MSWVLAFIGFAALIILHEFGHFAAAKAVGMRVERFALFFPPLLFKVRKGETEYGVGAIPLGGYVRITGMNPNEKHPPEIAARGYYRQPVWKRIVVIAAGPAMNILIAFLILYVLFLANGTTMPTTRVATVEKGQPAAGILQPGDKVISVDGKDGDLTAMANQISTHRCAGKQTEGCVAETPARVVIQRDGNTQVVSITPRYDANAGRTRIGFAFAVDKNSTNVISAAGESISAMWRVTEATFIALSRLVDPEGRKQISGVVGSYEVTRQSFAFNTTQALNVLAIISLSLAIINLFPFLPLDGGHIFWSIVEKVRGRAVPFWIMERSGYIGFLLVAILFFIGLSNDIDRLRGEGFGIR